MSEHTADSDAPYEPAKCPVCLGRFAARSGVMVDHRGVHESLQRPDGYCKGSGMTIRNRRLR